MNWKLLTLCMTLCLCRTAPLSAEGNAIGLFFGNGGGDRIFLAVRADADRAVRASGKKLAG